MQGRADKLKPQFKYGCPAAKAVITNHMFSKIKAFLNDSLPATSGSNAEDEGLAAAAVAVLVEAAMLDGDFDAAERATILAILVDRFCLSTDDANALIEEAVAQPESANRVYAATRKIRDAFSDAERIDVMEMLWEVAYADGKLHDFEANLVRRVAGLLYVRDRDSGQARKRVLQRLGLEITE